MSVLKMNRNHETLRKGRNYSIISQNTIEGYAYVYDDSGEATMVSLEYGEIIPNEKIELENVTPVKSCANCYHGSIEIKCGLGVDLSKMSDAFDMSYFVCPCWEY